MKKLLPIVATLLVQLLLRLHHIDALPAYADESLHIRRAEVAWDLYDPVASWQPGKLLLYYYLGLFETTRLHSIVISRLAVALFTLLGSTAIYALGKRLHSENAGLLGMMVYAVTPYALFFDRMALADPLATAIFALAAWACLIWAGHPTKKRCVLCGFLLALTPVAKLTGAGIVFAPILTLVLFDLMPNALAIRERSKTAGGFANPPLQKRLIRAYVRPLAIIYGIVAAIWIPLMIPVLLGEIRGGEHRMELVDEYLLNAYEEDQSFVPNLIDNIGDALQQIGLYVWMPALLLTLVLALILLGLRWRVALFLWGMLALAWLPTLAGSEMARTRYLTLGLPFLILMLAVGLFSLMNRPRVFFLGMTIYALAWGLPFFQTAIEDPTQLSLADDDRWRYMQAVTAGYGQQEAAHYLENEMDAYPVRVFGILGSCHLMRMFLQEPGPVTLICAELIEGHQLAESEIDEIEAAGADDQLYLLIERDLGTNFDDLDFDWTFVRDFERPHEGVIIELWKVSPLR